MMLQGTPAAWIPLASTGSGVDVPGSHWKGMCQKLARLQGRGAAKIVIPIGIGSRHPGGWNKSRERDSTALHLRLIIKKEERLILLDRPAERTAKLIEI